MREVMGSGDLQGLVREALGRGCRAVAVERLRGGSRKGVYRVRVDGAPLTRVIVYNWAATEDFWPGQHAADARHPFAPVSGLAPFLTARRTLDDLGVRVPRLLLADGGHSRHPADVAVVEDVSEDTLEALLDADPARAAMALDDLATATDAMHRHHAPRFGRPDLPRDGGAADGVTCERLVLDRALADLTEASGRDRRIAAAADRLRDRLLHLAALVAPRAEYGLIHGELGPDHVLVDADGRAVLIDIEGVMHFDVEWEHVFLRLRFGARYPVLRRPGLDPRRMDLYALATHLSLVAGPLRLLDGDFPDRAAMAGIAEHNLTGALALLP
ncbi:phosphotransferase [Streptomyces cellostaticus]|uniref:phosphotransferase n=1 Tax=Streptomyces cellostaticus TaxID=67285 RepID=UPI0020271454|nr:phosphotransferase [Streptomyces cellostaticus]